MSITHCKMFTPVYVSHVYRSRRTGKIFMGRPSVAYYVKQVRIIEDRAQSSNQKRAKPVTSETTKHRGTHESHISHSSSADTCQYRDNWTLRNSNDPKTQDPYKSHSQHSDKTECLKRKYEQPEEDTFQQSNNSEVLQVEIHGNQFQQHQLQSYPGQTINNTKSVSKVRQVASSEFYSAPKPLHQNGDHHVGHERSELTYDITDVNGNDLAKKNYSSSSPVIEPKWILKSNGRSNPECRNEPKLILSHPSKWVPLNKKDSQSYDRSRPAHDASKYLVDHNETHALSHPNVSNAIDFETTIRTRCNGKTTSTQQRQGSIQLDGITSKPVHSKVSRYYNEASTEFQNLHTSRDHNPAQHVDQDENTYLKTIADSPVAGSPAAPSDTHGTIDNRGFNSVENNGCNHDDSKQDSKHQDTTKKMSFGHETRHDATCHKETNVAFPVDPKTANHNKPRPDDSNGHGFDLVQDDGHQTPGNDTTEYPSKVAYSSVRVQEDKKLMNKEDQMSSAPHKVPHISFPLSSKPTSSDNGKIHESKKTKCDTQLGENFNPTETAICDTLQSGCLHNFQSDDSISSHGDHSNIIEKSFQGEESQRWDHNPPQHVDQDENTYLKTIADSPVAGEPTAPNDTHGTIDNRGFNSVENNGCNHDDSKKDSNHLDTTKKMSFGHETRHDATCHKETNVTFPVDPKAANNNKPRPDDSNGHGFDLGQDDGHQTPGNDTTEYPSKVAYSSVRVQEDKKLMNKEDQMSSAPHKVPHISFPFSSKPTSSDNGKIHESKKTKCDTQLGENSSPSEKARHDKQEPGSLHNFHSDDSDSSHGDHLIVKSFHGEETLFIPLSKIKEQLGLMPCSTSNKRQDSTSSRGTKAVDKEPLRNAKQILYNGTRTFKHVKDEDFPPPCTPSKPRTESTNIDNEYNKKPTLIRRSSRNASLSNLLAAASSSSESLQRDSTTQTSLSKSRKSKTTKNAGHYDQEDHPKNFSQFVERVGRSTNIDSKTFIYSPKTYNNINKPRFAAVNSNVSVTQHPESSSSDTESQDSSNDDDNDESSDKDKAEKGKN